MIIGKTKPITVKPRTDKPKAKISKSIIIYFLIPQLLFGIDFGFTKAFKIKFRKHVKGFTISSAILTTLVLLGPVVDNITDVWGLFNITEFILYLLSIYLSNCNMYDTLKDLVQIYELSVTEKRTLRRISLYSLIILVLLKCSVVIPRCLYKNQEYCSMYNFPFHFFYLIPAFGMNFCRMTQIVIVYYFYCCIKNVKVSLKKLYFCETDLQNKYLVIANSYDKIKPLNDKLVSMLLRFR